MTFQWEIIGYMGVFFAMIYRFPQISKIYKNKKGEDVSKKMVLLHNCAYVSLFIYLLGKDPIDYLLISYYCIGIVQNMLIVIMKFYYKNRKPSNLANIKNDTI